MSNGSGPVSVEDHLGEVLAKIKPLATAPHPLLDAVGRPVTADVVSPIALPSFDNSAMDGYAVRLVDVLGARESSPVKLKVVDEIHAGSSPKPLPAGKAMRIMTGAPIPEGADCVVPFEQTDAGRNDVRIKAEPREGQHVRRVGEDVAVGDALVKAGQILGQRHLGLLAGAGVGRVEATPRPRVVVISTGAELVEPGEQLAPGKIYDSNSTLLTAAVRATGALAYRVRVDTDEPSDFRETLEDQLSRADLVITTGGVSKGTRDVVKAALAGDSGMVFREVAMQPGKPQGFGLIGSTPLFALPGNPVSAYVSFELFVVPALRKMVGREPLSRPLFRATMTEPVRSMEGRRQYLRGAFVADREGPRVTPVGGHGSHLLAGLAAANSLIVLPEDLVGVEAGESVGVILLDRAF